MSVLQNGQFASYSSFDQSVVHLFFGILAVAKTPFPCKATRVREIITKKVMENTRKPSHFTAQKKRGHLTSLEIYSNNLTITHKCWRHVIGSGTNNEPLFSSARNETLLLAVGLFSIL
jgi:hypothetical protein